MRQTWLFGQLEMVMLEFRQRTSSSSPVMTALQESMNWTSLSPDQQLTLQAQVAGLDTSVFDVLSDFVENLWLDEWGRVPGHARTDQSHMKKAWLTNTCEHVVAQYQERYQPDFAFRPRGVARVAGWRGSGAIARVIRHVARAPRSAHPSSCQPSV